MPQLLRGQKIKLAELTPALQLRAGIGASSPTLSFDISCFGVDAQGQLSDDRYFVFFNQRASPDGALRMVGSQSGDAETFEVDLSKLPASIVKLVFALTVDGAGEMKSLQTGYFRLEANGSEVARFPFAGADFGAEKAIITAEIYKKDVWRLAAVGQGFAGGLSALLKNFGGEELSAAQSAPPVPTAPTPVSRPTSPPLQPTPAPSAKAAVSLTKVTLEKRGEKSQLDLKKGGGAQPIATNLSWDKIEKKGLFGAFSTPPDLDLGCMYRLKNGDAGVIQPLGGFFGARDQSPFILLNQDDRSGSEGGENLTIFRPDMIDLAMIFVLVYAGAKDFAEVGGHLKFRDPNGNVIEMNLNSPERGRNFCAICTIRGVRSGVEVTKEELYFQGHLEADRHFGFGFNWKAGSK